MRDIKAAAAPLAGLDAATERLVAADLFSGLLNAQFLSDSHKAGAGCLGGWLAAGWLAGWVLGKLAGGLVSQLPPWRRTERANRTVCRPAARPTSPHCQVTDRESKNLRLVLWRVPQSADAPGGRRKSGASSGSDPAYASERCLPCVGVQHAATCNGQRTPRRVRPQPL